MREQNRESDSEKIGLPGERVCKTVRERRHIHAHEFAVNSKHGRIARREMKVRRVLFLHEFEKGINAGHGGAVEKLVRCQ